MIDVSRRELKYYVSYEQVCSLKNKLKQVMQEDSHNGAEGYLVRSLYFDSLDDHDFEEKIAGCDDRRKIRLRVYDFSSQTAKLELKEKSGIAQRKRSLLLNRQEADAMMDSRYEFLLMREEPIAHWLYSYLTLHCYRPKCIVEYNRLAYCESVNDTRITFDRNLRATESGLQGLFNERLVLYPVSHGTEATMEVKYNGFLYTYIKNMLSQSDKMWVSNSKYVCARRISKKGTT